MENSRPIGARRATSSLRIRAQTVAGLDLQRSHSLGQQRFDSRQAGRQQVILTRRTRCAHGGKDAATALRDVCVGGAVKPGLEFFAAIARIDDVRVAIDQAGRDPAAGTIVPLVRTRAAGKSLSGPSQRSCRLERPGRRCGFRRTRPASIVARWTLVHRLSQATRDSVSDAGDDTRGHRGGLIIDIEARIHLGDIG